ncbi:hypothetical protein P691DRAFT_732245, partial [Macrolepiota fuliginosa MF-IS2]
MRSSRTFSALVALLNVRFVLTSPVATEVNRAMIDGVTFINKGIVAFGLIPSDFKESTGDTLGGIGSAIALKPNSWKAEGGRFSGTLFVHPDRGFNVDTTINYQSRHHEIDFKLEPYYGTRNLSFNDAQKTLRLTYKNTVLEFDVNRKTTSGLDPQSARLPDQRLRSSFPGPLPIVSSADNRLVLDVEGMIANPDGSFWISDEYGPGIYRYSHEGDLLQSIALPDAILPRDAAGNLNYTSVVNPVAGRDPNQGFENLTIDRSNKRLYAMLQSATMQDGGTDKTTSRYTRLFAFDLESLKLVGEWVVPLPLSSSGKTLASSEIILVRPGVFLALARDANGRGGDDTESSYKHADLFSIHGATDIHGTKFDSHLNPVAVNGVLDSSIKPVEYVSFLDYLNPTQLARFGLHNEIGGADDQTLISSKWESFALAPVGDKKFPDDYFLFTACDNDFLSTHGVSLGQPFDAGIDNDNQFLVFRVTLPGAPHDSY